MLIVLCMHGGDTR